MKEFRFRLESILGLRKSESSQALVAYVDATKKIQDYLNLISEIEMKESELYLGLKASRLGVFEGETQEQFLYALGENRSQLVYLRKLLISAKEEQAQKLSAMLEAQKREKMLEKLKEKKRVVYEKEFQQKEDLAVEELVCAKFINR